VTLRLYDGLSRSVREFVPLRPGEVRMYHCGPTVYKRQHVGNFRAFLLADLLRRSFEFLGYRVLQVMNITDVGHLTEDDAPTPRARTSSRRRPRAALSTPGRSPGRRSRPSGTTSPRWG